MRDRKRPGRTGGSGNTGGPSVTMRQDRPQRGGLQRRTEELVGQYERVTGHPVAAQMLHRRARFPCEGSDFPSPSERLPACSPSRSACTLVKRGPSLSGSDVGAGRSVSRRSPVSLVASDAEPPRRVRGDRGTAELAHRRGHGLAARGLAQRQDPLRLRAVRRGVGSGSSRLLRLAGQRRAEGEGAGGRRVRLRRLCPRPGLSPRGDADAQFAMHRALEDAGVVVINRIGPLLDAQDKFRTSFLLKRAGVATPRAGVVQTAEAGGAPGARPRRMRAQAPRRQPRRRRGAGARGEGGEERAVERVEHEDAIIRRSTCPTTGATCASSSWAARPWEPCSASRRPASGGRTWPGARERSSRCSPRGW